MESNGGNNGDAHYAFAAYVVIKEICCDTRAVREDSPLERDERERARAYVLSRETVLLRNSNADFSVDITRWTREKECSRAQSCVWMIRVA